MAIEPAKMVSSQTGVLVALILRVGCSEHHAGFPGTVSLKPVTMELVPFESVEMLIKS